MANNFNMPQHIVRHQKLHKYILQRNWDTCFMWYQNFLRLFTKDIHSLVCLNDFHVLEKWINNFQLSLFIITCFENKNISNLNLNFKTFSTKLHFTLQTSLKSSSMDHSRYNSIDFSYFYPVCIFAWIN
jgi:hypothetical protein